MYQLFALEAVVRVSLTRAALAVAVGLVGRIIYE
jgi:hypothetical protein